MERRILAYAGYLQELSKKDIADADREKLCAAILVQISFFQHERLIHLLVTILFALMAVGVFGICAVAPSIPFFGLEFMILVLLIPYIRHYFILENTVQKMYRYYDKIHGENWPGSGPQPKDLRHARRGE